MSVFWGVFGLGTTRRTALGDPQQVVVTSELGPGPKHNRRDFPVSVLRSGDAAALVHEFADSQEAYRVGALVAKTLHCRLVNKVDGTVLEADALARTLRDTLRARGVSIQVPLRELSFCCQYQRQNDADVITLPRRGFSFWSTGFMLLGILMSLGFGIPLGLEAQSKPNVSAGLMLFCVAMPLLMFSFPAALVAVGRQVVMVSSHEMKIQSQYCRGISGITIPANELKELVSVEHGLTVISDRMRIDVEHGRLTAREVEWLRAVIERAIAA